MEALTRNAEIEIAGRQFEFTSVSTPMDWAAGSIVVPGDMSRKDYETFVDAIPQAVVPVDEDKLDKSGCTDGRVRLEKLDGTEPEDWQKTVGADVMEMFAAAEALGEAFYGELSAAPVMERVEHVVKHMTKAGITPTTHEGCGARAGYVSIIRNAVEYTHRDTALEGLSQRLSIFADGPVEQQEVIDVAAAWQSADITEYDEARVRELVIEHGGGESVVEVLQTDETELHGHTEAAIVHMNTPKFTFSTRRFQAVLEDVAPHLAHLEAFAVNDDRINERLASAMSDDSAQQKIAMVAMHLFGDAGHATLSSGLQTFHLKHAA